MPAPDVDAVARQLARWGATARRMPRADVTQPLKGPGGEHLGRMLPGRGFYLDGCDLRALGITKKIPHVYERSFLRSLYDLYRDERGAITTRDGITYALRSGQGQKFTNV